MRGDERKEDGTADTVTLGRTENRKGKNIKRTVSLILVSYYSVPYAHTVHTEMEYEHVHMINIT